MKPKNSPVGTAKSVGLYNFSLALTMAVFFFAVTWSHVRNTPLGIPPDEWAHVTYVHEVASEGHLLPDYKESRILPAGVQGNYLGHPPLYYTTLGLAGRALEWDPVSDYRDYRALSAGMVALGLLLWILAGRALGIPSVWLIAFTAATSAVPMFSFLAGSVNNDNLAYLGVAIAFFGLVRLRYRPRSAIYMGALGVLIVLLTKATAALFLCAFFIFWAAPQWRDPLSPLRNRHLVYALCAAGMSAAAYYTYAIVAFGTPFPHVSSLYLDSHPPANPLAIGPFALEFAKQMISRLPIIMSHASLEPLRGIRWLFYTMLGLPVLAWLISRRSSSHLPDARLGQAFMFALLTTIVVHVVVVWQGYLKTGLFAGIQPRYYSYALPGLFLVGFLHSTQSRVGKGLFVCFSLATATLIGIGPSLIARAQFSSLELPVPQTIHYPASPAGVPLTSRISLTQARAGHVDSLTIDNGTARVTGWAIDRSDTTPARSVFVLVRNQVIGTTGSGRARPDVAKALNLQSALLSGFQTTIENLPANVRECDFQLAAEQRDGTLAMLPFAPCDK